MRRRILAVGLRSGLLVALWVLCFAPAVAPVRADDAPAAALAFADALAAGDADEALALFADGALIKEGPAVVAAGRERLHAWVSTCLVRRFALDPASRQSVLVDATAPSALWTVSWRFSDSTDCYWQTRPNALRPAWDVNPADGTAQIVLRGGTIEVLTLTYSAAWEARKLAAQAAPIRTAQAQRTQEAQIATVATATVAAEATASARAALPKAPDTQGRTTPSLAPWAAAVALTILAGGLAAATRRDSGT